MFHNNAKKIEWQNWSPDAISRAVDEVVEGHMGHKRRLLHWGRIKLI